MISDDSDSDDDDLLNYQVFGNKNKRQQRTQEKKVANGFSILEAAEKHAVRMKESDNRIALIKKEDNLLEQKHNNSSSNVSSDNGSSTQSLMAKVEETIANAKKQTSASSQQKDRDDVISGSMEDLENVLGRKRCRELGRAMDEDGVVTLGARHTMIFHPTNPNHSTGTTEEETVQYFDQAQSLAAYTRQLKETLRKLVSSKKKKLQAAWIQPLRKKCQTPSELLAFLQYHGLSKARQAAEMVEVPDEILLWLLRVACSSGSGDGGCTNTLESFRNAAMDSLQGLVRQNKVFHPLNPTSDAENLAANIRPACFALSQFAVQLQCWTATSVVHPAKDDDTIKKESNENTTNNNCNTNARGLERLLILWNTAFDMDQVSAEGSDDELAKNATRCFQLLAKLGLDVDMVHSTKMNFRLFHHLKCIMSQIILFIAQKLSDESKIVSWSKDTAAAIIDELVKSKLGPGEEESEDKDDHNAAFCFSLVCRILPTMQRTHKPQSDCTFQKAVAQFKAIVCMQALQHLFLVNDFDSKPKKKSSQSSHPKANSSWEDQVYETVSAYQQAQKKTKNPYDLVGKAKSDIRWLALCSTLTALVKINDLGGAVENDKPNCLAIAEIALGRCLDVGMELMKDIESNNENDTDSPVSNEYKTSEEARGVAILLGHVKLECTRLASRMNVSFMTPHFRRVGYLLQVHNIYIMDIQPKAASHGGDKKVVQDTLDRWVNKDKKVKLELESDDDLDDVAESPRKKQRLVLAQMDNRS